MQGKGWNCKRRWKTQTKRKNGWQKNVVGALWWVGAGDLSLQKQQFPSFQQLNRGTSASSSFSSPPSHCPPRSSAPSSPSSPLSPLPHNNCLHLLAMRGNADAPVVHLGPGEGQAQLWSPGVMLSPRGCSPPHSLPCDQTAPQGPILLPASLFLALALPQRGGDFLCPT